MTSDNAEALKLYLMHRNEVICLNNPVTAFGTHLHQYDYKTRKKEVQRITTRTKRETAMQNEADGVRQRE